jgi:hypothetical protein
MRLFVSAISASASLLLVSSSSSAIGLFLTSDYDPSTVLAPSGVTTVTVHLELEGDLDPQLSLLSLGVRFDDQVLTYKQAASSTSTYLFYTPASGRTSQQRVLQPGDASCGGGYSDPHRDEVVISRLFLLCPQA